MDKNKILKLIEEGVLNYYLDDNYMLDQNSIATEPQEVYDIDVEKYEKQAKQILFQAKLATRKAKLAKVISISDARGRIKDLNKKYEGTPFTMFKRHVEAYGLAANYRNFDKMSEDEMLNILQQIDITSLFDEIESELDDE
jgi:hypothetical protein